MNRGNRKEEIYRELTVSGFLICMAAGAAAEALIFALFDIRLDMVPRVVLVFLWGMFGFLSSGILVLADIVETAIGERRMELQYRNQLKLAQHEAQMIAGLKQEIEQVVAETLQKADMHTAEVYYISQQPKWNREKKADPDAMKTQQKKAS